MVEQGFVDVLHVLVIPAPEVHAEGFLFREEGGEEAHPGARGRDVDHALVADVFVEPDGP